MIANKGSLAAPSTGGDMTAYLNSTMNVTEQSDYTKVTCVDDADLTDVSAGKKAAAIELATNVSRIQIKDLAFQGVTGKVAGIFINGFYTSMELDGGTASLQRSFEKLDYSAGAAGSIFTDALQGCVYDTFDKTIAADAVNPENEVWGYNLFASATPQIIIKLTDVVAGAYNYADPQFVTVNGFKDKTTSAPIDNLTGGIIYTIESGALVIKPEHLSAEPGVTPFAVDVTVDHAQWEETLVVPNL
jgi:hypothetical protein